MQRTMLVAFRATRLHFWFVVSLVSIRPPGPSLQSRFPDSQTPAYTEAWHCFCSYTSLCTVKKRLYIGYSVFLYSANANICTFDFRHVHVCTHTHKYSVTMCAHYSLISRQKYLTSLPSPASPMLNCLVHHPEKGRKLFSAAACRAGLIAAFVQSSNRDFSARSKGD